MAWHMSQYHSCELQLAGTAFAWRGSGVMAAITRALTAGIAVLLVVPALYSQEAPKPGKEHELLKRMEGTWDVIMEGGKGTMTYKMGLGGLWLLGEQDGELGGRKFSGRGLDT